MQFFNTEHSGGKRQPSSLEETYLTRTSIETVKSSEQGQQMWTHSVQRLSALAYVTPQAGSPGQHDLRTGTAHISTTRSWPWLKLLFRYMRSIVCPQRKPLCYVTETEWTCRGHGLRASSNEVLLFWENIHFYEIQHWPETTDQVESHAYWGAPQRRWQKGLDHDHWSCSPPFLLTFFYKRTWRKGQSVLRDAYRMGMSRSGKPISIGLNPGYWVTLLHQVSLSFMRPVSGKKK